MENATKALLIAAGVLVVILIISLGIGIFNTAQEGMGNADLSEYQIQQHNDKFTKYEGTNRSGADVNAMIKTVFNFNATQENANSMITVVDNSGNGAGIDPNAFNANMTPVKVPTGARYSVTATYTNGMVSMLTIN